MVFALLSKQSYTKTQFDDKFRVSTDLIFKILEQICKYLLSFSVTLIIYNGYDRVCLLKPPVLADFHSFKILH